MIRLYNHPPEDEFFPRTTLDHFKTASDRQSVDVLPYQVLPLPFSVTDGESAGPDWWSDKERPLIPFRIYKVHDVYYFPWSGILIDTSGGVFQMPAAEAAHLGKNLTHLPFCKSDGLATSFHPPDLPEIEQLALTVPHGAGPCGNYGHSVLDALPAACTLQQLGLLESSTLGAPVLKDWQRRHFSLIGLSPTILEGYVYRVKTAIYTSGADHHLLRPHLNYLDVRHRQLAHFSAPSEGRERLYLSRGPRPNRINLSEERLQDAFRKHGFLVVDPAAHSVDEQINMFRHAKIVVGCTGAAFTNCLYLPDDAVAVEIMPTGMQYAWVQDLCAIVGCRYAGYFVSGTIHDPEGQANQALSFDLDVDRFVDFTMRAAAS